MPDVSSIAPDDVRLWVAVDQHKLSIVAATLPPSGGQPQLHRVETDRARDSPAHGSSRRPGRDWRSATRPGPAALTCCGCRPRSGSRAT